MLIHCKNDANHCKIDDLCIAVMLLHCKNNANHCQINDMCIAVMRIRYKNNANHCICNDLCIAVVLHRFAATAADAWPRLSQKVSKCCHLLFTLGLKSIAHVG